MKLGPTCLCWGGYANNTSFHLSEYRADWAGKKVVTAHAPVRRVQGITEWEAFQDINYHSDDFEAIEPRLKRSAPVHISMAV